WTGTAQSNAAAVTLGPEASAAGDEIAKNLAIASYSRLRGDLAGAQAALEILINRHPDFLQAYVEKADVQAAAGDFKGAITTMQAALDRYRSKNPNASEPPAAMSRTLFDYADRLAAQQFAKGGPVVNNVLPGLTAEVLTPESIAN